MLKLLAAVTLATLAAGLGAEEPRRQVVGQKRFNLPYRVSENLSGIQSVELWVTSDGGRTWELWGRDDDTLPPILFEAPRDGEYGFAIVATDKAGNREASPTAGAPPEAVVVVDTTAPVVRLDEPVGGEVVGPGANLSVRWLASDANLGGKCVDIQMSSDGGLTWRTALSGAPNSGSASVPLPGAAMERYLLKVVVKDLAGNTGEAVVAAPVLLDGQAPRVKLLGPKVSQANRIEVAYEAEDIGGAGIGEVMLWYSTDGGLTWKAYGRDPDLASPIEFITEGAGTYGFYLQATDRAGNSTAAPARGTRPELLTVIDTAPPRVELLSLNAGGAYRGGDSVEIRWRAEDDNMAERPIAISYSSDGGKNWLQIADKEPNDGSYAWVLPRVDAGAVVVRVSAVDALGNTGAAQSPLPFVIDSTAPKSVLVFEPVTAPPAPAPLVRPAQPVTPASAPTPAPAPAASDLNRRLDEVEKWLEAHEAERMGEALRILDTVLTREDPRNARAYYLRGLYYYRSNQQAEAQRDLEQAVSLAPGDGKHNSLLGRVLVLKARQNERVDAGRAAEDARMAALYFEKAIAGGLATNSVYLWSGIANYMTGKLANEQDKLTQSVARLDKAIDAGGAARNQGIAYNWRAEAKLALGDLAGAADDFERAASLLGPDTEDGRRAAQKAQQTRARLRGAR